jgi:hypothetical protein
MGNWLEDLVQAAENWIQRCIPACGPAAWVRVRMQSYSGRPDPEWELADDASREVLERIQRALAGRTIAAQPSSPLGFRGYVVSVDGDKPQVFEVGGGALRRLGKGPPTLYPDDAGVADLLRGHALQRGFKEPGGSHTGGGAAPSP